MNFKPGGKVSASDLPDAIARSEVHFIAKGHKEIGLTSTKVTIPVDFDAILLFRAFPKPKFKDTTRLTRSSLC